MRSKVTRGRFCVGSSKNRSILKFGDSENRVSCMPSSLYTSLIIVRGHFYTDDVVIKGITTLN